MTINDEEYRGYIRPFHLTVPEAICRSAATAERTMPAASTASATPDAAPSPSGSAPRPAAGPGAASTDCQLYLIGLIPAHAARSAWLSPPRLLLVGFGLAVAFVLALLPLVRLLLINATEAIGALGVLAIVLGLAAAAAIATLGLLFAGEASAERRLAADEASAVARSLAAGAGREIAALNQASLACRGDLGPGRFAPAIIDASFLRFDGHPGDQPLSCDWVTQLGHSAVGGRSYFEKLKQLPPDRDGYVLDQLVGQTDGLDKTVLARSGLIPGANRFALPARDSRYALRVATIIRSLLAPTLPPHEKFMVVDTESSNLRVLFHSHRARAGIEHLVDQLDAPGRVANQLRHLVAGPSGANDGNPPATAFRSRYDGVKSHFAAAAVPDSGWVVLVYYPDDEVDGTAAATALRALVAWASLSIIALLGLGVALLCARRDAWRRLWPFENGAAEYRRLALEATILTVAVILLLACLTMFGPQAAVDFMPVVALGASSAFVVRAFFRLGKKRLGAEPLSPATEQAYLRFVLAMLACAAVAPMLAFWTDARALSRTEVDIARSIAARRELGEATARSSALASILGERWTRQFVFVAATIAEEQERGLAAMMRALENGAPPATFDRCTIASDAAASIDAERSWFCAQGDRLGVIARPLALPPLDAWLFIVIFAGALMGLFHVLVAASLEALTGFGIPLGAVTWPKLVIDGPADPAKNQLLLASKSLLVAPQQAVRDRLARLPHALPVDLADQLLPAPDDALKPDGKAPPTVPTPWKGMTQAPSPVNVSGQSPWARLRAAWHAVWGHEAPDQAGPAAPLLIVSGLELVLRDSLRRRAALAYLERAATVLAASGQSELGGLVIIAEMAPLERIFDAFESFAENDQAWLSTREELRWARLFQDFSTFYFAPIDKVENRKVPAQTTAPTWTLIEELRWLPGAVIDGVIADHSSREALTIEKQPGDKSFPLPEQAYRDHYTLRISQWAASLGAKTSEAAIDYMRANLIEHYEQCWAASSFAERVILDAIARHSFINMRKAVALQSLVRRGLLIMDPAPRLMNQSFGLYLRQNERPDTLARWKAAQPRSTWSAARLPLALLLPALLIMLVIGTAESGQTLGTLFPLLAAGLPAVVSLLIRSARAT